MDWNRHRRFLTVLAHLWVSSASHCCSGLGRAAEKLNLQRLESETLRNCTKIHWHYYQLRNMAKTCKADSSGLAMGCWYHCCFTFLSALCLRISSTSCKKCTLIPWDKKDLSTAVYISLVKVSAIWAALCTHLINTPSFRRSLITRASSIMRYSEHWRMEVFWRRS